MTRKQSALHLVTAWATKQRLVLAQVKVEDKSNEITAIPALLELLDLSGAIITLDAMGTQTSIARQIIENQADYILALNPIILLFLLKSNNGSILPKRVILKESKLAMINE